MLFNVECIKTGHLDQGSAPSFKPQTRARLRKKENSSNKLGNEKSKKRDEILVRSMATLTYRNDNRWQRNMTWSLDGLSRSLYKQCSNNPLLTLLSLAPQLRQNCQRYLSSHIDIFQQGSARIRIFFLLFFTFFFPRSLQRPTETSMRP